MFKKVVVKQRTASYSARAGIRLLVICIAMLTFSQSVGCKMGIREAAMVTYRDLVWAKRAYNLRYANCDRAYSDHFQNGFCAGYTSICQGGDGYVPALPPADYRSFEYQSSDGAKCVNAWFEGFPEGVAAAKKDKAGTYHDVLISRMINSAVEQSKTKPVLEGDIPVVSANVNAADVTYHDGNYRAPGNGSSNRMFEPVPSPHMPSVLSPVENVAPPQAQAKPIALPEIIQATYQPGTEDASSSHSRTANSLIPAFRNSTRRMR